MPSNLKIYPLVDGGIKPGSVSFWRHPRPASAPITVELASQCAHNDACGCTKCWKPEGAVFSVVAVVPCDKVSVTPTATS